MLPNGCVRAALKWTVWLVLGLLALLAMLVVFGLGALRGPIERAVTEATGRELRIEGSLKPVWDWVHPRFRAEGVRFAFMRSDPSGYVTKRLPLPRLPLPRYGNACPLWVIYGAFQTPGVTVRSFGELTSGEQFLFFARAIEKRPPAVVLPVWPPIETPTLGSRTLSPASGVPLPFSS